MELVYPGVLLDEGRHRPRDFLVHLWRERFRDFGDGGEITGQLPGYTYSS
jgi:hypothetical protein